MGNSCMPATQVRGVGGNNSNSNNKSKSKSKGRSATTATKDSAMVMKRLHPPQKEKRKTPVLVQATPVASVRSPLQANAASHLANGGGFFVQVRPPRSAGTGEARKVASSWDASELSFAEQPRSNASEVSEDEMIGDDKKDGVKAKHTTPQRLRHHSSAPVDVTPNSVPISTALNSTPASEGNNAGKAAVLNHTHSGDLSETHSGGLSEAKRKFYAPLALQCLVEGTKRILMNVGEHDLDSVDVAAVRGLSRQIEVLDRASAAHLHNLLVHENFLPAMRKHPKQDIPEGYALFSRNFVQNPSTWGSVGWIPTAVECFNISKPPQRHSTEELRSLSTISKAIRRAGNSSSSSAPSQQRGTNGGPLYSPSLVALY